MTLYSIKSLSIGRKILEQFKRAIYNNYYLFLKSPGENDSSILYSTKMKINFQVVCVLAKHLRLFDVDSLKIRQVRIRFPRKQILGRCTSSQHWPNTLSQHCLSIVPMSRACTTTIHILVTIMMRILN